MNSLTGWLEQRALKQYAELLNRHAIDLDVLTELSDTDLKDLGIPLGDRKRFLKAFRDQDGDTVIPEKSEVIADPAATPEGERRQLTVLFCDLVGFTELASRVDPEVLQGIIRTYEDACAVCITRYEGYVFQRLGDGIVAFFGFPLAHEGEAERAIHAGLSIIDSLSCLDVPEVGHLKVRIGIATGLVVVSSAEKGAVGETMNLASRLQGIAPVGGIVVSERVRQLAGGRFLYDHLGEQHLKGIARPASTYRVLGVSETASRFEAATQAGLTPMVGREQELGLLLDKWSQAREGEGQAVLLSGEPGIGKSRILSALRERLESQGASALRFQCSPYHTHSAFYPSIDNLERALKFGRDENAESKLDKLEALLVTQYGRPQEDVRFIAAMLSVPTQTRFGPTSMTPQRFKDETLRSLVDLTEAAARKQPSVMLFEDAHWADPTTLEVLDLLIDRTKSFPLLIVMTHRPEFQNRWASHGHVTALNLSKLTKAQSAAMVNKLAKNKPLPGNLLEQILAKTDGVPLFVEELTKAILESKDIEEKEDRYEYTGEATTITIPATLRDSLMARLDRNQAVKEIAQIGAAIGREFSYELIEAVAPKTQTQLGESLQRLTDSGLAFRRGTPPQATYTFKHALVQDVAYDSLLKSRRKELHGAIADVILNTQPDSRETKPELLAQHLTRAERFEEAIPLWLRAGNTGLKRMALVEAIAHLDAGLKILETLPASRERDEWELDLRTTLGTAWMARKGWASEEAQVAFAPTLTLAKGLGKYESMMPILWGFFSFDLSGGRIVRAIEKANEWLVLAKEANDQDLLAAGYIASICATQLGGCLGVSRTHTKILMNAARVISREKISRFLNHDPSTCGGVFESHSLWMLGYPEQAISVSIAKDDTGRQFGHAFNLGHALIVGGELFSYLGDPATYRARADEALMVGQENDLPLFSTLMVPTMYAAANILEGQYAEGLTGLQRLLPQRETRGQYLRIPYFKTLMAQACAQLGDYAGAERYVSEALDQIERPGWGERAYLAEVLRVRAWIKARLGDTQAAEHDYLRSLAVARSQKARSWELRTATSLAHLWETQGKRSAALELLKPVYDWFTEGFGTKDLKDAKALLEDLAG